MTRIEPPQNDPVRAGTDMPSFTSATRVFREGVSLHAVLAQVGTYGRLYIKLDRRSKTELIESGRSKRAIGNQRGR